MIGVIWSSTEMASPYLVQRVITFIQEGSKSPDEGLILVGCLIATQFVAYICQEHQHYNNTMAGQTCSNVLRVLIFEK